MFVGLHMPAFRRTPGARRPANIGNMGNTGGIGSRTQFGSIVPRPLFPPSQGSRGHLDLSTGSSKVVGTAESTACGGGGVELVVTNLDYNISMHEWKKILMSEFQQQVQVC